MLLSHEKHLSIKLSKKKTFLCSAEEKTHTCLEQLEVSK